MKQPDKKKKIAIIIAVTVVLVAAIVVVIVFATKGSDTAPSDTQETEYVTVIDENGNEITLVDENNNPVTVKLKNENESSTANTNSDKNTNNSNNENTTESVTETTTQFTTVASDKATVLPEEPFDDRMLTESMALYSLQRYYGEKYVVNYDVPNNKDGDNIAFAVFANDDEKTNIVYRVTVNLYSGKTVQTDKNGKTNDISDKINY